MLWILILRFFFLGVWGRFDCWDFMVASNDGNRVAASHIYVRLIKEN